ncbi:hypothetical protein H310_12551 [Aphanomyces invadans]|uniref:Uncharacterized protein n=1 Tax=Aphanomyces invadans TaxID=157072 RepID=A0A024THQ1_9STRA|nr:hypothetical protein H310_12551 [Aphanomyces invadans]ETV93509.1 hypothetical protein H310_12551 [Aphanomyces invadans]|eukprot:XP_008877851.1 hypothetical protein H310_12551 [Aphanomyces invadans]
MHTSRNVHRTIHDASLGCSTRMSNPISIDEKIPLFALDKQVPWTQQFASVIDLDPEKEASTDEDDTRVTDVSGSCIQCQSDASTSRMRSPRGSIAARVRKRMHRVFPTCTCDVALKA